MTDSAPQSSVPPHGARRWGGAYIRPIRTAGLALAALFATDRLILTIEARELQQAIERQIRPAATALTAALDERIAVLSGVASFLSLDWGRETLRPDFVSFTDHLMKDRSGFRTIQYLVGGVIQQTWPVVGNEAAQGLNVLDATSPQISAQLRRAMSERGVSLTGPTELAQGGVGLIARTQVRDAKDSMVAVAAVVIDRDNLINSAGLKIVPGLKVRVVDEFDATVGGEPDLGKDLPPRPIEAVVNVANREWRIQAIPDVGWNSMLARLSLGTRLGFGIAFVLVGAVTLVYGGRNSALAEVERQKAKQRGEEKFVKLFAMTPDGVMLTRASDGEVLEVNPGFSEICHLSRAQLIGHRTVDLGLWPSQDVRDEFVRRLQTVGSVSDYAVALARPDGQLRETRASARLFELDGEPCVIVVMRDVTEQSMLERRLEVAARLEAVGRLAGGVAHDFNNLITGITGYSEILQSHLKSDPLALSDLGEIIRASTRATNLTKQLLAFARRQMVQPRVVDLNALVLESNSLLRKLTGDSIELTTILSPNPARVLIDPAQGDQLLTNLTINARDAMPKGGQLRLQVMTYDTQVVLQVSDTGVGIPVEVMPHVFEPFYTTKATGRGTGLGLATCYGIMQQAGGTIDADSVAGNGAVFTLTFPRVPADLEVHPADLPMPDSSRTLGQLSGETILIAEDELQVRRLCERLLRDMGYNVLTAENGIEALAVAEAYPGTIDLLLTDMVMPGMGGAELVKRFAKARPATKVLQMSGYSEELIAAENNPLPFMAKPFTPAILAEAVKKVMLPEKEED